MDINVTEIMEDAYRNKRLAEIEEARSKDKSVRNKYFLKDVLAYVFDSFATDVTDIAAAHNITNDQAYRMMTYLRDFGLVGGDAGDGEGGFADPKTLPFKHIVWQPTHTHDEMDFEEFFEKHAVPSGAFGKEQAPTGKPHEVRVYEFGMITERYGYTQRSAAEKMFTKLQKEWPGYDIRITMPLTPNNNEE